MNWTGKLFGGALGLFVGGPFGLALGATLGHLYDTGSLGPNTRDDDDERARVGSAGADSVNIGERFFATTFQVMGHVAKSDGRVSEREIRAARAVMSELRLDARQVRAAITHFTVGKQSRFDLPHAMQRLRDACTGRPDLLRVFLEIQMRAALAGADLVGPSRGVLTQIGSMLGVSAVELAQIETVLRLRQGRYGGGGSQDDAAAGRAATIARMGLDEAFQILEIAPTATADEVVKAYRRQLSRHHPDKLKANGLPDSMLEHAKQRTQQIIEAHERIRAERGLA
jgi:DnaJ like chaperone protein